jgi:hypothetical protein
MPSVEDAAVVELRATAANILGPRKDLVFCEALEPRIGMLLLKEFNYTLL